MEVLNIQQVANAVRTLRTGEARFEKRIEGLCEKLLALGFHSVRYYEAVHDAFSDEDDQFVLTHASYRDGAPDDIIGLRINRSETTLATSLAMGGIARGFRDESTPKQQESWVSQLGISGTSWIDIEIKSNARSVGLLALSWSGAKELVRPQDEVAFYLIKEAIASCYEQSLYSIDVVNDALTKISGVLTGSEAIEVEDLEIIAEAVNSVVKSDAVSVFKYDWVSGKIAKQAEYQSDSVPEFPPLEEAYHLGENLTGSAFDEQRFRFVPDFGLFDEIASKVVSVDCVSHHTPFLGAFRSVIYFVIGTRSNRLLVRCLRGESHSLPPYTDRDFSLLEKVGAECTKAFDFAVLEKQKAIIEGASISGLKALSDQEELIGLVESELASIGAKDFVLVHLSGQATSSDFVRGFGQMKEVRSFFGASAAELWGSLRSLPLKSSPSELGFRKLGNLNLAVTSEALRDLGCSALGVISVANADTTTAILLPFWGKKVGRARSKFVDRLDADEFSHLESLISILGSVIEAKSSIISAESADDLLANIGHELQSPIAEIEQSAIFACETAIELLEQVTNWPDGIPPEPNSMEAIRDAIPELEEEISSVNKTSDLLRHFMDVPLTLSEYFGGDAMPVTFERRRWAPIITDSWKAASRWANEMSEFYDLPGRSSLGGARLVQNPAIAKMECVMSEPLIKMVLTNLFKNAIKFSLPRYRSDIAPQFSLPMVVEINGIPQTGWNIFQIKNWGIGIRPDQFEEIFGKYSRVDRLDAKRDITGRGLGLYLSRAMLRAQGGEIFCESSVPTLDDSARTEIGEGFSTTFELRLPTSNTPGSRKVRLQ